LTHQGFVNKITGAIGEGFRKDKLMAGNVIELTDATFDEVVHSSDVPVLIDFWAPWCGPCKMMAPIIEEIADEYADKAKICKLNTDEARDSAMEFGINAIPTTILFKDGQVQNKWVGLTSKKGLVAAIDKLL
jgi:thioredoxin 1